MARSARRKLAPEDHAFAELAEAFCRLVETRRRRSARALLRQAHRQLPRLYSAALELRPIPDRAAASSKRLGHEVWKAIHDDLTERLGSLGQYCEIFDPYDHGDEPVWASLADDLSDIYCDLKPGCVLWRHGFREAAINGWLVMLQLHWFGHASGAIRALSWLEFHYHMARTQDDLDELMSHARRPPDSTRPTG